VLVGFEESLESEVPPVVEDEFPGEPVSVAPVPPVVEDEACVGLWPAAAVSSPESQAVRPPARATVAVTARTRRAERALRCERMGISIDLPVMFSRSDITNARAEVFPE